MAKARTARSRASKRARRASALMSLGRAARIHRIGGAEPARALKYNLQQVERETGLRLMLRTGSGKATRYRVTAEAIEVLREHRPKLFADAERIEQQRVDREIGRHLAAIADRQRELVTGALGSIEEFLADFREHIGIPPRTVATEDAKR